MRQQRNQKPINNAFSGNILISGKWIWVNNSTPTVHFLSRGRSDVHRFKVTYVTPQGKVETCLAMSQSSNDIKTAMVVK